MLSHPDSWPHHDLAIAYNPHRTKKVNISVELPESTTWVYFLSLSPELTESIGQIQYVHGYIHNVCTMAIGLLQVLNL